MSRTIPGSLGQTYLNVMESLVAEEVEYQLQDVPAKVRRYLKPEEVVTYALNRLPALYASSERGVEYQRQLAKREHAALIKRAVHQAIMAVQVDPIRLSQPLRTKEDQTVEAVLKALRSLFDVPDLDWPTALEKLQAVKRDPALLFPPEPPAPTHRFKTPWQPGTYGTKVAWVRSTQPAAADQAEQEQPLVQRAGWNNPLYSR